MTVRCAVPTNQEKEFWQIVKAMRFAPEWNGVDGTSPVHARLRKSDGGFFLEFLRRKLETFEPEIQKAVIFLIAQRLAELGDAEEIRRAYSPLDSQLKAEMLQGLADAPASTACVAFELALDALIDPAPEMRGAGCRVVHNLSAKGVNAELAVPFLLTLVSDPSDHVRMYAMCAVGGLAKDGYHLQEFVSALLPNLLEDNWSVRTYGAGAIWKPSRKHDISESIPTLAQVLLHSEPEWEEARKNAVGALLHFARKSSAHSAKVFRALPWDKLDRNRKEIQKLAEKLSAPDRNYAK